jgi:formylmethanofuran dehydrogenase subunit E
MNAAFGLLQIYCGVAVGRNQRKLKDMGKAVWAMFLHKASADNSPH